MPHARAPLIAAHGSPTWERMQIANIPLAGRTVDERALGAIRYAIGHIPGLRFRAARRPMILEYVAFASSLLAWGEIVQVHCGGGRIEVRSFLRSPFQLVDFGRNAYNVARVTRAVKAALAESAGAVSSGV